MNLFLYFPINTLKEIYLFSFARWSDATREELEQVPVPPVNLQVEHPWTVTRDGLVEFPMP
jgi:hypothetical protein